MELMDELIAHLGPLEEWPTYVLEYLFLDRRLCPTHTSRLRKVMIFFFENSVPVKMAYNFYVACSGCTGALARFVVDKTREWYCAWSGLNTKRHIGKYYNVGFKKCYYLNGALLNQQELVVPEPAMQFGIDETFYPSKIRRRLEELPSVALVDDADECSPLSDSDSSSCCL